MTFDPHLLVLAAITLAAGWLMAVAGLEKSALEWRRQRRICPSCGKTIRARVCTDCGAAS
jgi:NADH pyrophosphatase NudC (nudix superfamily)